MADFFESNNSKPGRLFAIHVTDTHEAIVFEAKWKKPMAKKPHLKWVRIGARALEDD